MVFYFITFDSLLFLRQKLDPEFGDMIKPEEAFKVDSMDEDCSYSIFVSFIEIYNNYVYDLLEETPEDTIQPKWVKRKLHNILSYMDAHQNNEWLMILHLNFDELFSLRVSRH